MEATTDFEIEDHCQDIAKVKLVQNGYFFNIAHKWRKYVLYLSKK